MLLAPLSSTKLQESLYGWKVLLWETMTLSFEIAWIVVGAPADTAITALLRIEIPNPLGRQVNILPSAQSVKRGMRSVITVEDRFG